MKAITIKKAGGPEALNFQDIRMPEITANEILIKVKTISVNFADVVARRNKKNDSKNIIPGLDCSGVVEDVGSNVASLVVGQRVVAFPTDGSYAEYVSVNQNLVYPIPDSIDFDIATAALTVGVTAFNTIVKVAKLNSGESILIHAAAGGIGTTAIQIAKNKGASRIIGTVGSDSKKQIAKNAGADKIINYREESFVDEVLKITDNKGVDVILDTIAGKNFEDGMNCLADFGRMVIFGHISGSPGNVTTDQLHSSCRSVIGYSTIAYRNNRPLELKKSANKVLKLIEEKSLDMVISKKYNLSQANEAHEFIESRQSTGKILLKP